MINTDKALSINTIQALIVNNIFCKVDPVCHITCTHNKFSLFSYILCNVILTTLISK